MIQYFSFHCSARSVQRSIGTPAVNKNKMVLMGTFFILITEYFLEVYIYIYKNHLFDKNC